MDKKPIAIALVVRDQDILVVRRRGDDALLWQFPSGEIENGEDAIAAAVREVAEETNVSCRAIEVIGARVHPVTKRYVQYVSCEWISGDPSVGDPDELDRAEWIAKQNVSKIITTGMAPVVEKLLAS